MKMIPNINLDVIYKYNLCVVHLLLFVLVKGISPRFPQEKYRVPENNHPPNCNGFFLFKATF
jgi:hypothetical protein